MTRAGGIPTSWRGRWPAWRATLRLARRQALRAWPTSLLVVALVALPMAALSGAVVFTASRGFPTQVERADAELGRSDAWLQVVGGYDPSRTQAPNEPGWVDVDRRADGTPVNEEGVRPSSPDAFLPLGVRTSRITGVTVGARTAAGETLLRAVVGAAWDPQLDGRYEVLDGAVPAQGSEAMVSPAALERLGLHVGDTLRLTEPVAEYTITGTMKAAAERDDAVQLFLPGSAALAALSPSDGPVWFVTGWTPTAEAMRDLNRQGVVVFARVPPDVDASEAFVDAGSLWGLWAVLTAVSVFAGYLVVLLAGAAFSVGARRQQQSLAVAASVGAARGDLFRIVVLQGTVLGLVGGVSGAAVGIGLGAALLHAFDDGSVGSFWGLHVPWAIIAAIVVFAVLVGTVAALLPARAVTRGDTLGALRGARRPVTVRVARPAWGSLILAVGIAITIVGALGLSALNAETPIDFDNPMRGVCFALVLAGPLLFQIGVIVAGHWLLSLVARATSRLGLAARLASRDAAANPGRVVPAFGAIAACTFIAVMVLCSLSMNAALMQRTWSYAGPIGSLSLSVWSDGTPAADRAALEDDARALIGGAGALRVLEIDQQPPPIWDEVAQTYADDESPVFTVRRQQVQAHDDAEWARVGDFFWLAVVSGDDVAAYLDVDLTDAQRAAYRAGAAIVTDPAWVNGDGSVELNELRWPDLARDASEVTPVRTLPLQAISVSSPHSMQWRVFISTETAAELGMSTGVSQLTALFDGSVPQDTVDRLAAAVNVPYVVGQGMGVHVERGPDDSAPWLWLTLGVAGALTVAASTVALGLARVERRPDDASLTAVGAGRGLRRRIAWWQASIITGFGTITGTLAALLPTWGFTALSPGHDIYASTMADVSWVSVALLAAGLPLVIAAASWLIRPRTPDLTRRTAIG